MDFSEVFQMQNILGLLTLIVLETVLGVDNIIFMAIQLEKLPPEKREKARIIGLTAAAGVRVLLLLGIGWLMKLESDLFFVFGHGISGKDLVMIVGGLYLLYHSVKEIHHKVNHRPDTDSPVIIAAHSFGAVIVSILLLDVVFSIDSVLTAIGMVKSIPIMITAVIVSIVIMLVFSGGIIRFINKYPAVQILALAFLVLIGVLLVAEGFGQHVSKGYVYSAVAFGILVELLQIRAENTNKKTI